MHKWLFAFLLAAFAIPVWGQQSSTGNLTAASTVCASNTVCVTLTLDQTKGGAGFTLTGTWSGTVQFEGCATTACAPADWNAINATPSNGSTAVTSATGNGLWQANVAYLTQVRIRCSTFSSGTIVATINGSSASARTNGSGGAGAVSSVFTRTGAVTAQSGDYTCAQVTNCGGGLSGQTAGSLPLAATATTSTSSSLFTDNGTTGAYTGTGGFTAPSLAASGSTAGYFQCTQGTANGHATANTITDECPASVTAYEFLRPGSAATGIMHWANSSGVVTGSISAVSLSADVTGQLPISAVGSAGLSATLPIVITSAGAISTTSIAGFRFGNAGAADTVGTAAQAATLIQGLTGCNTATYVFTPQASDCVAPSGGGAAAVVGCSNSQGSSFAGVAYNSFIGMCGAKGTVIASPGTLAPRAGTVANLTVSLQTTEPSVSTLVVTLYQNGSTTALTCTVAAAANTCTDYTHTVAVAQGDNLTWQTNGTGTTAGTDIAITATYQ